MRTPTTPIAITTAAFIIALTACGTSDTDADTSTADDERVTDLEATVEALQSDLDALAADVADIDTEPAPEAATEPTGDATADDDEGTEPEPATDAGDDDTSDTGGTAELGEAVTISGFGEGFNYEQAGTISLNDVEVGYTNDACYDAPINDHYLALNLTVEADADAYEEIAATQFDFYLVDDEGTIYRDDAQTFEAYSCASTAGSLEWVPPGTNHTGYILLDTDLTEGTIVYEGVAEDVVWSF